MSHALVTRYSSEPRRDGSEHVLVLLHGYGSHELDLLSLESMLPEDLLLVSLRAPIQEGPGFAWFPLAFQGSGELGFRREDVLSAAEGIERHLADELRPADFASVSVLGFSQGMALASVLAQRRRVPWAAVVGLSGFWVPADEDADDDAPAGPAPLFWGRGLADPVIPQRLVEETAAALDGRPHSVVKAYEGLPHAISPEEMRDVSAFLSAAPAR